MSLQKLLSILPPPDHPVDSGSAERWPDVERQIGTVLPEDYKAFIDTYGTGIIGYLIRVHNPFSQTGVYDFFAQLDFLTSLRRRWREERGAEWCPYPLYPDADGLIPWGNSIDGDTIFWDTRGSPETWTVVVAEVKDKNFERFALSTTAFLAAVFNEELESDILADVLKERGFEASKGRVAEASETDP
jgi:hypothetical protein